MLFLHVRLLKTQTRAVPSHLPEESTPLRLVLESPGVDLGLAGGVRPEELLDEVEEGVAVLLLHGQEGVIPAQAATLALVVVVVVSLE